VNITRTVIAVAVFVGFGTVVYLARLVHASEHEQDKTDLQQLQTQTTSLLQIVNSNMLTEELMRAAQLRRELEVKDDEETLRRLVQTEQTIDQLRKSMSK
jgi:uncharacterized membrane protein